MADDKKNEGFMAGLGALFQQKKDSDEEKKKKNAADKIKDATKDKNAQLEDLYSWGKGGN